MLSSEEWSCVSLLKAENIGQSVCDRDYSTTSLFSMKKIKNVNKHKLEAQDLEKNSYICCGFIGASDVIV